VLPVIRQTVVPLSNSNPHLILSLEISPGDKSRIKEINVQTRSRESAETPVGQVLAWQNAEHGLCGSMLVCVLLGANE